MRRGKYLSSIIALSRQPKDNLSCYRPAPGLKSLGGGGGGKGNFLYMVYYGRACRIAPFFSTARYMIGPLFSTKSIWMAQFFWIPYEGPIFLTSWYMHIFFAQRFFEAAYPLGITWISDPSIWWVRAWTGCDICETTSKNGYKKIKGQFMNRSTFWMIKYMNGSVFSKARYMNGVGFEIHPYQNYL